MVDMMDEQSFHGLEDYSFFFPLRCFNRKVGLISQNVTENHQAMFSLLQLSRKMNWTEYQIDLKRSRNVSSFPSFPPSFLLSSLSPSLPPFFLPSFFYQLCKCIQIICLISNVKMHYICTYICLPVTSEQLLSFGCNHINPRRATGQQSVLSSNALLQSINRVFLLMSSDLVLIMDEKITPNLKLIGFSFESSKFYHFCSSCPFALICAIKLMAASPQFQE